MTSGDQGLPEHIAAIFKRLAAELTFIYLTWSVWKELFTVSSQRVELMNQLAPGFFVLAQDALVQDLILRFCRLCDPSRSFGHDNLSLRRLVDGIDPHA